MIFTPFDEQLNFTPDSLKNLDFFLLTNIVSKWREKIGFKNYIWKFVSKLYNHRPPIKNSQTCLTKQISEFWLAVSDLKNMSETRSELNKQFWHWFQSNFYCQNIVDTQIIY